MNISSQCDVDAAVAQNLAEGFRVEAYLHAACSESVPQAMKIRTRNSPSSNAGFKAVLHSARLNEAIALAAQ